MKKKRIGLWLNIVTIAMCLCAIAVGVYSLKTASLSISGTLGFVVRNVKANVTAYIRNDCVDSSGNPVGNDGSLRADYSQITTKTIDGGESNSASMSLGSFYFGCEYGTTAPSEVYMKFVIENKSNFPIKAYITPNSNDRITFGVADGSSSYVKILQSTGDAGRGEIIIKLTLNPNDSGEYEGLSTANNVSLNMTLEQYHDFVVEPVKEREVDSDGNIATAWTTTNRLCTYLGHGTLADKAEFELLRWYAFAVRGTGDSNATKPDFVPDGNASIPVGSETWYSLTGVDMSTVDYKGYTYWFIQEYVVAGGYNSITGKVFNSDSSKTYSNIYKNDTYTSDIYKYINGTDGTTSEYLTDTGICSDKYYIDKIKDDTSTKRTISDSTETNSSSLYNSFSSKFWLISVAELGLLANEALTNSSSGCKNHILTYGIGDKDDDSSLYGVFWWLRSPLSNNYNNACAVRPDGSFGYYTVGIGYGVRAAFQISI